jgi:hypothetical protein
MLLALLLCSSASAQASPASAAVQPLDCQSLDLIQSIVLPNQTAAVYVNTAVSVPPPVYRSNSIFWISRENLPGQSVLLSGAFTASTKQVRLATIQPGTTDWQSVVELSTVTTPAHNLSSTGLTFLIPTSLTAGVIAFRIEDPSAAAVEALANAPEVDWVQGIPSSGAALFSPQYHVNQCGVEPGGVLRVFGRNFPTPSHVTLTAQDGVVYALALSQQDANSITALVPASLAQGQYFVGVGYSDHPGATASAPIQMTVYPAPSGSPAMVTLSCSGLIADGKTDDTAALQKCFDAHQSTGQSHNTLVFFHLTAGQYAISGSLTLHPYQYLIGDSPASTTIVGRPRSSVAPATWIAGTNNFGMLNITLSAPVNGSLFSSAFSPVGWPWPDSSSGHILLYKAHIVSDTTMGADSQPSLVLLGGPDIRVLDSVFDSTGQSTSVITLFLAGAGGALVSGNTMIHGTNSYFSISNSQDVIFEQNYVQDASHGLGGAGMQLADGSGVGNADAGVEQNIYTGYNTFSNLLAPPEGGGQGIGTDGGGGSYLGLVALSSADVTVLANDPNWNWLGNAVPQHALISIIGGTGLGECRTLKSISGRLIQVEVPWDVPPDATSVVTITLYERHLIISRNQMSNIGGTGVTFFGKVYDSVVENNQFSNVANAVQVMSVGNPYGNPGGYLSTFDNEILNNTISGYPPSALVEGHYGIGVGGIGYGAISGLLIRGNTVAEPNCIFLTNDVYHLTSTLIEGNRAVLAPWTQEFGPTLPAVLLIGNTP